MIFELKFSWLRIAIGLVLGLIAAVYILDAFQTMRIADQRGKQKRAMREIKTAAFAVQDFIRDHHGCPPQVDETVKEGWKYSSVKLIERQLAPEYIAELPTTDPWGNPYVYGADLQTGSFCFVSMGKDGKRDSMLLPSLLTKTSCFENDIIWSGNAFLQVPEGKQGFCGGK